MVRTKEKILAEVNDPNTVIATGTLQNGLLLVGAGNKGIKTLEIDGPALIYIDANGQLVNMSLNGVTNKVLIIDSNGKLALAPMSDAIV